MQDDFSKADVNSLQSLQTVASAKSWTQASASSSIIICYSINVQAVEENEWNASTSAAWQ